MTALVDIEGIGEVFAAKLKKAGVNTQEELLEAGATPKGRKALADKSGIGDELILDWVNLIDLFRIKGIGSEYSDLLEAAGVDTVVELSNRNAENLHQKLVQVNKEKELVRRLPTLDVVADWIKQAKNLPRKISY